MLKKIICTVLLLSLLVSSFSGCGILGLSMLSSLADDEPEQKNSITSNLFGKSEYQIDNLYYEFFKKYIIIVCAITNTGETNLYLDDAKFDIYDGAGNLTKVISYVEPNLQVIMPGEEAIYFVRESFDGEDQNDNYSITPHLEIERAAVSCVRYDLSEVRIKSDSYGYPKIIGKVKNNTSEERAFIRLAVNIYDKEGYLLYVIRTSITEDLEPGTWTSFEESIYSPLVKSVDVIGSYSVWIYPLELYN